jgi:glycosyltransferase involved in cell wall biosynthesis
MRRVTPPAAGGEERDAFVSVVIPTLDRPEPLRRCLASLATQRYPRERLEVVVVDDGSRPPAQVDEVLYADLPVSLVRQDQAGPAAARNRGAAVARGRFLVFLDDDCVAEPDWLAALEAAFRAHAGTVLFGGEIINPCPDNVHTEVGELILDVLRERFRPEPGGVYFFRSMNLAVRADEFAACGGFDASLRTAEDREFSDRWLHRGGRLVAVPAARVVHARPLTFREFARRYYEYGRGAFHFHRIRRARGSGRIRFELLAFYAYVVAACVNAPPRRRASRRLLLAAVWQACNTLGFAVELLRQRFPRGR